MMTIRYPLSRRPYFSGLGAVDELLRDFERIFRDRLPSQASDRPSRSSEEPAWGPPVDIRETDEAYEVSVELPGLGKDDVNVTVEENILIISGERKWISEPSENYHRIERSYGKFARSFTLPHLVKASKVMAAFRNGILDITIPKAEAAKPRTIAIT